jgi:hypothetical protein
MNKFITGIKNIRITRIVTGFLASLFLFVATACSNTPNVLAKTADDVRPEVPRSAVTNTHQGGMNEYSDVDPRRSTAPANSKAKALIENAQRNIDTKSADSRQQYGENYRSGTPIGERVKRLGEDVGESAEELAEGAAKGTKQGLENIRQNARNTSDYVEDVGEDTANVNIDKAQAKINNAAKGTRRAFEDTADASQDLGKRIQRTAEDAGDAVKYKVNRDINRTQRALDNAADAID